MASFQRLALASVVALALSACQGSIDEAGPDGDPNGAGGALSGQSGEPGQGPGGGGTNGGGTNGGGSGANGGAGGAGASSGDPRIPARIWRLSPTQLNREIRQLLGEGAPEITLPASAAEHDITNIAANTVVDLGNASVLADGARAVATWAAGQGAAASRCSNHGTVECIDEFLAWFVSGAFRRPATTAQIAELRALFDNLYAAYDYDFAFAGIVRAVLLSPDFLYRTELGTAAEPTVLTQDEIANLLAFAITEKGPDAQLLQAAQAGSLTNADEREAQARRLMAVSEPAWQRFFWDWLGMKTLDSQGEEVGLDPALVAQMREEFDEFVREVIVAQRDGLRELLSASYTFIRPELAAHYGATHPGGGLARVELDPTERGGLLTQGAWLVSHGKRGADNVVRRGMGVFVHAMCNDISVPPNLDVQAELLKLVGPNATVRETVEARGNSDTCGGCHRMPDSVGMVFESYASDGQWQTTYIDGNPVDTNVDVTGLGQFDSARELALALVDDERFQHCFVQRIAHQLVGYDLGTPASVAWTQQAHARFVETDTSLEELLVALVRHPAFIERGPQEAAP